MCRCQINLIETCLIYKFFNLMKSLNGSVFAQPRNCNIIMPKNGIVYQTVCTICIVCMSVPIFFVISGTIGIFQDIWYHFIRVITIESMRTQMNLLSGKQCVCTVCTAFTVNIFCLKCICPVRVACARISLNSYDSMFYMFKG